MAASSVKLRVMAANIDYQQGLVQCMCVAPGQTHFGNFNVDYPVFITEDGDLGGNPAWTNDDLKAAIALKTGLTVEDIKFVSETAVNPAAPPPAGT